jgi:acetyl-CoA synthetase
MKNRIQNLKDYVNDYHNSVNSPEKFWSDIASSFQWKRQWDQVLNWNFETPSVTWFENAELNLTENIFERLLPSHRDKTAIIWEPNDPNADSIQLTYGQLFKATCKFANAMKSQGVQKGDRVIIYMPMVPEAAIAMLACARIGAIHSVVFAGFSSSALADRINDCEAKMVLTSDGNFRGKKNIPVKAVVDEALEHTNTVEKVIVLKRTGDEVEMKPGRDIWWNDAVDGQSENNEAEVMNAEDLLFILYTSGSTGKPKGVVHTTAGYMVYTYYSFLNVFQYDDEDVYWCTADIGWITGHSYILYGPLANGATTVMFEGVPSYPDYGRFWEVVEKHKITQFYTAPTAIRALAKEPLELVEKYDLSSLKVLGSVGEPINEEAWHWYNNNVGKKESPIVDTWWQTETGGIMISPIPYSTPTKPTFATLPFIGVQPALMDENGKEIKGNQVEGRLCIKFPWPSIARTIWGNHERYRETYFSAYKNMYFTGDGASRDAVGYYRITGRVDDVIIVSGHNLGTAPIEDAINEHQGVAESAIVGFPHDIKGNALFGYVILKDEASSRDQDELRVEINRLISEKIGPIAKLDKIVFVPGLPKTRSGKIMRRILRKIASNDVSNLGDISTLLNPDVVEQIKKIVGV